MTKELYNLGEMPPLGVIPPKMHAWLIRPERFGKPMEAFQQEVVNTPPIADDEVLVVAALEGQRRLRQVDERRTGVWGEDLGRAGREARAEHRV